MDEIRLSWDGKKVVWCNPEAEELKIPEGVEKIDCYSIDGCRKLKRIYIPSTLVNSFVCGWYNETIFRSMLDLEEFIVAENNPVYVSVEGALLERHKENMKLLVVPKVKKGCFSIPEGVTKIEDFAFFGCCNLEQIRIPTTLLTAGMNSFRIGWLLQGEEYIKPKLRSIEVAENHPVFDSLDGILLRKGEDGNQLVYFPGGKEVGAHFKIPNEISAIEEGAFCDISFKELYIPKGVKVPANLIPTSFSIREYIVYAEDYLHTTKKMEVHYSELVKTATDCSYALLYQSGKKWVQKIDQLIEKKDVTANEILCGVMARLEQGKTESIAKKAVDFVMSHSNVLDKKMIKDFYAYLYENKSKALAVLISDPRIQFILLDGQIFPEDKVMKEEKHPIELFVRKHWKKSDVTDNLQKIIKKGIKYKDSEKVSSTEAIIFIIAAYAEQMDDTPNYYSMYKNAYVKTSFSETADKVAEALNREELQNLLEKLVFQKQFVKEAYVLAFGRYAVSKQISELLSKMREWEHWGKYGALGRKQIIMARGGLMLSDTREAMLAVDKAGGLDYYAKIRGTGADTIRDTVLSDFGFDENGQKKYNLGGNIVAVSLSKELVFEIYDENAGKYVKSLPKKGADVNLYEEAKKDFADLKKNVKRVIDNRKKLLFEAFLGGTEFDTVSWKQAYLPNPVLRSIGSLILWMQGSRSFIITKNGVIDSKGKPYEIEEDTPIRVAHPMEMEAAEVEAWQAYFVENEIKQPFEQVWEPVYAQDSIEENRYEDCEISVYRVMGKEMHGITAFDFTDHSEFFGFRLKDCEMQYESDTEIFFHGVTTDATFRLGKFSFQEYTRNVNHIVYLFDKWTISERILKDESNIGHMLKGFTAAQILELINLAIENKCSQSVAVLMDYKNTHFDTYDLSAEFTLD